MYIINAYLVEKYIGYSLLKQVNDIFPFILLATIVGIVVYYVGELLPYNEYVLASAQVILYMFFYIVGAFVLKLEVAQYILNIIITKIKRN